MQINNALDGSFDLDWLRYLSREKAKYGFAHKTYSTAYFFTILLYSFFVCC